ncbi:hypothetical protein KW786_02865 [Candidatus Parcubacteria bacterium]|nr:hypothetical protein [Candidatus Parcubacteria bacterium]
MTPDRIEQIDDLVEAWQEEKEPAEFMDLITRSQQGPDQEEARPRLLEACQQMGISVEEAKKWADHWADETNT